AKLPSTLPNTLAELHKAQERWVGPLLTASGQRTRPRYIGNWNAVAMFMAALFAQPELARSLREPGPVLPSGGPTYLGLKLLHKAHVITSPPAGLEFDDKSYEPSVLYDNNGLFAELRRGPLDWSLVDVHSGL